MAARVCCKKDSVLEAGDGVWPRMPMETLVLLAMGNAGIHAQEPSFHHDCIHLTLHLVHQDRSHQRNIASMKSALINFYFQKQRLVID